MASSGRQNNYTHLLAGVSAGLVSTITFYPLELLKTRMQVIEATNKHYRGISPAVRSIIAKEGFAGFYRGMLPGILAASGSWGGYFYLYEYAKDRRRKDQQMSGHSHAIAELGVHDHLLCGVQAGCAMVMVFNPLWLIKTRLAIQAAVDPVNKYTGLTDAVRTIFRCEGFFGFYRGVVPALFLTSHGAIQFAAYEKLKILNQVFARKINYQQNAPFLVGLAGGLSKIAASTATYPYQVIKSRLQQGHTASNGASYPYNGVLDCTTQMFRSEGFRGFFRGVIPATLKVVPSSALTFVVYEAVVSHFGSHNG